MAMGSLCWCKGFFSLGRMKILVGLVESKSLDFNEKVLHCSGNLIEIGVELLVIGVELFKTSLVPG